jgi:hypothetical protein
MIKREEQLSPRRKTCPRTYLSTKNAKLADLGSNPGLRSEGPATNRPSHGTAPKTEKNLHYI